MTLDAEEVAAGTMSSQVTIVEEPTGDTVSRNPTPARLAGMLLKRTELEAIRDGRVSLVFRRWRGPTVKAGGSLKTAVGVLAIDRVDRIALAAITARDARAAGHGSPAALRKTLAARVGDVYRIALHHHGPDPRLRLREEDDLDDATLQGIADKLARLDAAARSGAWTRKVLGTLERHPHVAAAVLAERIGLERDRLKTDIRKLKNLGLTISHHPGYELSPRGKVVLQHLRDKG